MNKLFKSLSFVALVAIMAVAFTQVSTVLAVPQANSDSAVSVLPNNLTKDDTMGVVEQKLGQPDRSGTDHIHYWASYDQYGVTVIYSSPYSEDKTISIHKILVNK